MPAVTSSKSASRTPFDTKRGARWAIAAATRGSLPLVFVSASDMPRHSTAGSSRISPPSERSAGLRDVLSEVLQEQLCHRAQGAIFQRHDCDGPRTHRKLHRQCLQIEPLRVTL